MRGGNASTSDPAANAYTEFGATGLKQFSGYVREEWLKDLIGRRGLLMYREMRDNDPIIGAIFFAIEMLLRGVSFHVEAGDGPDDQEAAEFVESCLGDTETSWAGLLAEIMPFLLYGWDVHEIVYKIRKGRNDDPKFNSKYDDGMIGWRKFAHRGQETLLHWIFDAAGDATHLVQLLPTGGPLLQVPLGKCLHFRTTPYKANPEGRSIFRNAYTSYYFKKVIQEIEAIGVSRDLTGLTVVSVPAKWTSPTASPADKQALLMAQQLARDTARNQQEGLVIPIIRNEKDPQLLEFDVKLLATGGRRQFATNDIIQRYDNRIAMTTLADFITLGSGSGSGSGRGSFAMSKNKTDIFSVATIAFLDLITAEFNRKAIPDLLELNGYAKCDVTLAHGDIQRRDLQELGTYIMDVAQAGVLTPDANLEAHVREEGGLPPLDPEAAYPDSDLQMAQANADAARAKADQDQADQDDDDEEDKQNGRGNGGSQPNSTGNTGRTGGVGATDDGNQAGPTKVPPGRGGAPGNDPARMTRPAPTIPRLAQGGGSGGTFSRTAKPVRKKRVW